MGRPRLRPRERDGEASAEILAAASALFHERGVMGTTMAQIASAAGLQQSSLYYYFGSKEEVLAAIVATANVVPLELVRRIGEQPLEPAVRVWLFVAGDVVALCTLPFDINEVHRYAARDRQRFATYWKERRTLQAALADTIREGVADESLRQVNARLVALTLMSNDEAVQNWYRHDTRPLREPTAIGAAMADLAVGGLLVRSAELDGVRERATISNVLRKTRSVRGHETEP
jgi:TetR/AcrR family transcriptional regulator